MEKIKLTFLGTGPSIPTKKRNHTSIFLQYKNEHILIDCGEGTQRQLKIAGISPLKINKIIITHWHGDHFLGIPGLFQTLATNNYTKKIEIYGPKGTEEKIELIKKLIGHKINTQIIETSSKAFENSEILIKAMKMSHGVENNAYSFSIKEKRRLDKNKIRKLKLPNLPILKELQKGKDISFNGKKIKSSSVSYIEKERKITFILDTEFNANAIKIAEDSDILICESTFSKEDSEKAQERMHLTSEKAALIAKKSKSKKLILTHLSERYENNMDKILKEAKTIFKETTLAKDFDKIEI